MALTQELENIKSIIWDYYTKNKRDFPWRETTDPYKIFISEVMLQQTQTYRVVSKYEAFIQEFPDFPTLAHASFSRVLRFWSGLGFNRRALYLQKAAQMIVGQFNNKLPADPNMLITLPGIGNATACSISVFSFNTPLSFIETNIRRVFIHFFYDQIVSGRHPGNPPAGGASRISSVNHKSSSNDGDSGLRQNDELKIEDKELMPLVQKTLDSNNPREWYYALMDYGAMLGKTVKNPNTKSAHYVKQSRFEGSLRQVRGKILRILLKNKKIDQNKTYALCECSSEMFEAALLQLENEGFLTSKNGILMLI